MGEEVTRARINAMRPKENGDLWLWDGKISGFGVKMTKKGVLSYYFQYRMGGRGTRTRRLFLGRCAWVSLEDARESARQAKSSVFRGVDPFDERKRVTGFLFEDVALEWLEKYSKIHKRKRGHNQDERVILKILNPLFKGREISSITRADVESLQREYNTRRARWNQILVLIKQIFEYGIDHYDLASNPAAKVRAFPVTARERRLLPDELPRFLSTLDHCEADNLLQQSFINLIRLLLFSGCRRDEIRLLEWKQINLDNKSLRLPTTKTKPRTVFLNALFLETLKGIKKLPKNPYVIHSPRGIGPLVSTARPWAKLCKLAKLDDFHIHDLRHTFASLGVDHDIPLYSVGKLLGHARQATTARYSHLDEKPQRQATERISQAIQDAMSADTKPKKGGNKNEKSHRRKII